MGSRQFLPLDHSWRNNAKAFDGTKENRLTPRQLFEDDIVQQYHQFDQVSVIKCCSKILLKLLFFYYIFKYFLNLNIKVFILIKN